MNLKYKTKGCKLINLELIHKKSYVYDYSKSFFRNLAEMLRRNRNYKNQGNSTKEGNFKESNKQKNN